MPRRPGSRPSAWALDRSWLSEAAFRIPAVRRILRIPSSHALVVVVSFLGVCRVAVNVLPPLRLLVPQPFFSFVAQRLNRIKTASEHSIRPDETSSRQASESSFLPGPTMLLLPSVSVRTWNWETAPCLRLTHTLCFAAHIALQAAQLGIGAHRKCLVDPDTCRQLRVAAEPIASCY
ncbi:hypothetical protein LX32DRAFT_330469 [Colletotrichum zoysiae]|uniref:Uncharacterized protein n=1 Tax=Colletotrichum zoysiae TaxID=1216348 RepID=A0AAD9M6E2_9PEZI|nr:hypothetical protein LX32DRAFT_330469 [Colletotrichum zoysiae]